MPLSGLASNGVYMCPLCCQRGGSLLHCPSTLTQILWAVHFCCTGLGVASTGRYPASCPVKPGLSSPAAFRPLQLRLPVLLAPHTLPYSSLIVKPLRLSDSLVSYEAVPVRRCSRKCIAPLVLHMAVMPFHPYKCDFVRFFCLQEPLP